MHIREFASYTGVSVRTLHYYDEIGLLKPAFTDERTGYRFYDECSLLRMQEILFYGELDFSLKSIADILSSPGYKKEKALSAQKKLLTLKKERLERLISAIDDAMKGKDIMKAFDNSEFEKYKAEAQEKWGNTDAYHEYTQKSKHRTAEKNDSIIEDMNAIFADFADCMNSGAQPASTEAQMLVKKLQAHITDNFYTCTEAILAGLGQMYVLDERFRNHIDKHGEGTAEFTSKAIGIYCHR